MADLKPVYKKISGDWVKQTAYERQGGEWVLISTAGPEPIAYLYNGVQLPPLPEWDKETYPYAVIIYQDTDALSAGSHLACLYLCENPVTAISSASITKMGTYINGKTMRYDWVSDERLIEIYSSALTDAWGYRNSSEYDNFRSLETLLWANHDVLYTNVEGVRRAASEPVPVYE